MPACVFKRARSHRQLLHSLLQLENIYMRIGIQHTTKSCSFLSPSPHQPRRPLQGLFQCLYKCPSPCGTVELTLTLRSLVRVFSGSCASRRSLNLTHGVIVPELVFLVEYFNSGPLVQNYRSFLSINTLRILSSYEIWTLSYEEYGS